MTMLLARRRFPSFVVAVLVLAVSMVAAGPAHPARAGGSRQRFVVSHHPPGLLLRGEPAVIHVFVETSDFESPQSAFVFLRDEPGAPFTKLRLFDGGTHRRVPEKFLDGTFLEDYVVVQDSATDRTLRVPPTGAFRSYIRGAYPVVDLGQHHFGHVRQPDRIVARASIGDGPHQVAWFCPPEGVCEYPWSFDVGPKGEVWMLDPHHSRVVGWFPNRPAAPARSFPISFGAADLSVGPHGDVFVFGFKLGDPTHLGRVYDFAPNGELKWWHHALTYFFNDHLRFAPDGVLYVSDSVYGWVPVTSPDGAPLSIAEQRALAWPDQTVEGGGTLRFGPGRGNDLRAALIDGDGRLGRAWRIVGSTPMEDFAGLGTPATVDGDPVLVATVYQFQQHLEEHVVLRLSKDDGVLRRFSLPEGTRGGAEVTNIRVGWDGALYQLQGSPDTGVRVARYSLD